MNWKFRGAECWCAWTSTCHAPTTALFWMTPASRRPCPPSITFVNGKPGSFLHDRILYGTLPQFRTVNPVSPRYSLSLSIDSII